MIGFRLIVVMLGIMLDWRFGDPARMFFVPHPVIIMGKVIGFIENRVRPKSIPDDEDTPSPKPIFSLFMGFVAVLFVLSIMILPIVAILWGWDSWINDYGKNLLGWWESLFFAVSLVVSVLIVFWLLAAKGLDKHVSLVADAVAEDDLSAARQGIQALAGRSSDQMDASESLRTAGESLAENYSDGVVAPIFWYLVLGVSGIVLYKTVNSLDSMWGYRRAKYLYFGRFAARLDDVMNFIPARLAAFFLWCGAIAMNADAKGGVRCVRVFAKQHPSPNAGYPEAMMAGAMNLRFGGPREYPGGVVETVWLGEGKADWQAGDLYRCLKLYRWAILCLAGGMIDLMLIWLGIDWFFG